MALLEHVAQVHRTAGIRWMAGAAAAAHLLGDDPGAGDLREALNDGRSYVRLHAVSVIRSSHEYAEFAEAVRARLAVERDPTVRARLEQVPVLIPRPLTPAEMVARREAAEEAMARLRPTGPAHEWSAPIDPAEFSLRLEPVSHLPDRGDPAADGTGEPVEPRAASENPIAFGPRDSIRLAFSLAGARVRTDRFASLDLAGDSDPTRPGIHVSVQRLHADGTTSSESVEADISASAVDAVTARRRLWVTLRLPEPRETWRRRVFDVARAGVEGFPLRELPADPTLEDPEATDPLDAYARLLGPAVRFHRAGHYAVELTLVSGGNGCWEGVLRAPRVEFEIRAPTDDDLR